MRKNRAFTLIELMVVIMIVAILAAVLVPMIHGRINRARWSEGMAGAGTIATCLRAYCVEQGVDQVAAPALADIGLTAGDLQGNHFASGDYTITALSYTSSTGTITYTIQVADPASGECYGGPITLDQNGDWTGINNL